MPSYRYEAVDAAGATNKGVLHADSPRAARSTLRARGLLPLAITIIAAQVDTHANFLMQLFAERLSTNELALFTRQLSSLLEAGLRYVSKQSGRICVI